MCAELVWAYVADVEGNRCRGRPKLGCMNGVRMALGERGKLVEQVD